MSQLALGPCPGDKAARQVKCGPVRRTFSRSLSVDTPEYKTKFDKACQLLASRINLDGIPLPAPGFFERRKLRKASLVFQEAAEAAPGNAAPLLMLGKIKERLGNKEACSQWLLKANEVENWRGQPSTWDKINI